MMVARPFIVLSTRIAVPARKSRRFIAMKKTRCRRSNECAAAASGSHVLSKI
jgi:hypothetical protein